MIAQGNAPLNDDGTVYPQSGKVSFGGRFPRRVAPI